MPDFSIRSSKKELLDEPGIPFDDIKRNMKELETINKWLGGHRITIKGVQKLIEQNNESELRICEIGCGGGDNLKAIHNWGLKYNHAFKFIGVDINEDCIAYARENCRGLNVEWITSDYREMSTSLNADIVFSSLFCHHFNATELSEQFGWMSRNSRLGFFVNDLHRHPLAFYSIRMLSALFSRSYLVKNDAPLSVLRGFNRKEMEVLKSQLKDMETTLEWHWAFRWLLTARWNRVDPT